VPTMQGYLSDKALLMSSFISEVMFIATGTSLCRFKSKSNLFGEKLPLELNNFDRVYLKYLTYPKF